MGSTVDVANATWANSIGAPELIAVWKDPGFGVQPLPGTRMTVTERAYTSPIWYTPE